MDDLYTLLPEQPSDPPRSAPPMSALSEASTPAQDAASAIDAQQLHQLQQHATDIQQQNNNGTSPEGTTRKAKAPSVRRACTACHTGKTRCSEVLPCQSCLKRGIGATCAYPDPEIDHANPSHQTPGVTTFAQAPIGYVHGAPTLTQHQYYDYNGTFTGASSSTFRPSKRPRNLTEEEAAAITRNFSRGDFFVGSSAPVRIDPRLPVRLTLGEGDHVHFSITESLS